MSQSQDPATQAVESPGDGYAKWESWSPKEYLAEYYAEVMADERFALEFLVESVARLAPVATALEFGCGPTVHHAFALVPKVGQIHMADYLESNRHEVRDWLTREPGAHDWTAFAEEILRLEGIPRPSSAQMQVREDETRAKITSIVGGDAGENDPLGETARGSYPLVTSHYCAEGATSDKATWQLYMRNICSLVAPEGTIVLSACGAADFYTVGSHRFPCAGVTAVDVLESLVENGFGELDLRVRHVPDHSSQGYGSVIFASAKKHALDGG